MTEINTKNDNFFTGVGASMGISAAMTRGFGIIPALKVAKKAKNAGAALPADVVSEFMKRNTGGDSFTRAFAAARNYETYSSAVKSAQNATRQLEIIAKNGGKATLWQRIKNFGKGTEALKAKYNQKITNGTTLKNKLLNNEDLSGAMAKGFKANAKGLFKYELLNPMNLIYAATSTWSRIKTDAIPAFQNEGVGAGIKKTLGAVGKSIADVFSNAGFSAGFRLIGSRIGMIAGPIGAAVGGTIGDIFGTFVSNKLVTKIFGEDKPVDATANQNNVQSSAKSYRKVSPNSGALSNLSGQELVDYANSVTARANSYKYKNRLSKYA